MKWLNVHNRPGLNNEAESLWHKHQGEKRKENGGKKKQAPLLEEMLARSKEPQSSKDSLEELMTFTVENGQNQCIWSLSSTREQLIWG